MGLKKNNVPVEMILYPREPHALGEPRHRLDKMTREYAWFSKHVLGKDETVNAPTERDKVLDVIQKTFDALAERSAAKFRAAFWPEAVLAVDRPDAQGNRQQTFSKVEDFARSIEAGALDSPPVKEVMHDPQVQIDGNIASVWTKYTFTRGDYSAEGVDSFQLVRRNGEWKIFSLTYTHTERK